MIYFSNTSEILPYNIMKIRLDLLLNLLYFHIQQCFSNISSFLATLYNMLTSTSTYIICVEREPYSENLRVFHGTFHLTSHHVVDLSSRSNISNHLNAKVVYNFSR